MKYVLDTNLYVRYFRAPHQDEWWQSAERFVIGFTSMLYLHSVVAFELLSGAITPELERETRRTLLGPLERRGRVITPRHGAWERAAAALTELIAARKLSPGPGITKSLVNDSLIAASARDDGFTLITENTKDFALLQPLLPIEVVAPWPRP